MSDFYTNVIARGKNILYRGIENGRRVRKEIEYFPTLFLPSREPTKFRTISGQYLAPIKPGNIKECRDYAKQYEGVSNFKVYGNQRYEYVYISDICKDGLEWDRKHIVVANIDIEVGSENGFPYPETAEEPLTAITYKCDGKFIVLGCGEFKHSRPDVTYTKCDSEVDLILKFLDVWGANYPDIVTGWHIKFFDIPYLVNRITKLLGTKQAHRLSPWGWFSERSVIINGKTNQHYVLSGIATLDYIELYKKFVLKPQESYKLDHIASDEIGERKIAYEGTLHTLYRDDYQKFIEYNIRDVELVDRLDAKLRLIDLAITLAYTNKCNFDDVFAQVRMWDAIVFDALRKQNIVVPPAESHEKNEAFIGAYVKEPVVGLYGWLASYDFASLYPSIIIQSNISPECIVEPEQYTDEMRDFLASNTINIETLLSKSIDTSKLREWGVSLTPNGQFFRVAKTGILPTIMDRMFRERQSYKKKALAAKQEKEHAQDKATKESLENQISRYNNLQLAFKVSLNSCYGALGNQHFRFFDIRQAMAITTSGQLAVRWIADRVNKYLNKLLETNSDYVIASDTDSIYVSLADVVFKSYEGQDRTIEPAKIVDFLDKVCETKLQSIINTACRELSEYLNSPGRALSMKREAIADRGIWVAKKCYVLNIWDNEGVRYTKPDVKVSGLAMVKSSTPASCRSKLKQCLAIILEKDEKGLIAFVEDYRREFKTLPLSEISSPRGVNNIEKYSLGNGGTGSGTPIHVYGAIKFNHLVQQMKLDKKYAKITSGEKIKYIYLKKPNTIQSHVISFSDDIPKEFGLAEYIDYEMQFEMSFLKPLKIITDVIGWNVEKTSSLKDFYR